MIKGETMIFVSYIIDFVEFLRVLKPINFLFNTENKTLHNIISFFIFCNMRNGIIPFFKEEIKKISIIHAIPKMGHRYDS